MNRGRSIFLCLAVLFLIVVIFIPAHNLRAATTFGTTLVFGSRHVDVKALQEFLIRENLLAPGLNTGYFGILTNGAVKKFQKKYEKEVLTPIELSEATGIVGPLTRAKINALIGDVPFITTPSTENSAQSVVVIELFSKDLKLGSKHSEVKRLKEFLNSHGFSVSESGAGSAGQESDFFGEKTDDALRRFQKTYQVEILIPLGLSAPTGIFGPSTRKKINEILSLEADRSSNAVEPRRTQAEAREDTRPSRAPPPAGGGSPQAQAPLPPNTILSQNNPAGNGAPPPPPPVPNNQDFFPPNQNQNPPVEPPIEPVVEARDTRPPSVPSNVSATALSPTGIMVRWNASSDESGVLGYIVSRDGVRIGNVLAVTSFVDTNLQANSSYSYTVAAYDVLGNISNPSLLVIGRTLPSRFTLTIIKIGDAVSYGRVTGFAAGISSTDCGTVCTMSVPYGTSVTLSASSLWAPNGAGGNPPPPNLSPSPSPSPNPSPSPSPNPSPSPSPSGDSGFFRISPNLLLAQALLPGNITASFSGGGCSTAPTCTITIVENTTVTGNFTYSASPLSTDTTPPSVPQNLSAIPAVSSVILTWKASSDAVGVAGYLIVRGGAEIARVTTGTSFTDSNLTHTTSYTYQVFAFDAANNVSSSLQLLVTTSAPPPTITLDWQQPGTGQVIGVGVFGKVSVFDEKDEVVNVRFKGTKPVTFSGMGGLSDPYTFKGGAYPGIGGTCQTVIFADCTIVINFKPRSTGLSTSLGGSQYLRRVQFRYLEGTATNEFEFRLLGSSFPVANVYITKPRFGTAYGLAPRKSTFSIYGASTDSHIRISGLTPLSPPFSYATVGNGTNPLCREGELTAACLTEISFTPTSPGKYSQTFSFTHNNGIETKTETISLAAEVFFPDPAQNLLIVYNEKSENSVELKNYYLANRPGISNANVLAISYPGSNCLANCTPDAEIASFYAFDLSVRDPLVNWIRSHPEKDIRHVVLLSGIPSRLAVYSTPQNPNGIGLGAQYYLADAYFSLGTCKNSAYHYSYTDLTTGRGTGVCTPASNGFTGGYFSPRAFPGSTALYTHLDMGSVEATKAYIDKLKRMYEATPSASRSPVISASAAGRGGSTYYFNDSYAFSNYTSYVAGYQGEKAKSEVLRVNPGASVMYRNNTEAPILEASDVRGFITWGANAGFKNTYATDPTNLWYLRFSGNSGWYPIQTIESYNGQRNGGGWQGNFINWFSKNAFGSTNYENTPVGAVTYVEEPGYGGINSPAYFSCWEEGQLFIDCAWASFVTPFRMAVGDPWVRR